MQSQLSSKDLFRLKTEFSAPSARFTILRNRLLGQHLNCVWKEHAILHNPTGKLKESLL
jgi:hypothetical protein